LDSVFSIIALTNPQSDRLWRIGQQLKTHRQSIQRKERMWSLGPPIEVLNLLQDSEEWREEAMPRAPSFDEGHIATMGIPPAPLREPKRLV